MDLKEFAKTYSQLESKAIEIMKVYDHGHYDLESISVDEEHLTIGISMSIHYSGCGTEYESLSFDLEEMNKGIEYFESKHKEEVEVKEKYKKLQKEKETKERKEQKDKQDKIDYERLKNKFETKPLTKKI